LSLPEAQMPEIRGRDIAMIFQEPMSSLNPVMSIGEQIVEAVWLHERLSRRECRARAVEMLGLVGIPAPAERLGAFPHQFSGGMLQSIPRLDDERRRLYQIAGSVPVAAALPSGCPFHPRCPERRPICSEQAPPMVDLGNGQSAACWVAAEQVGLA